MTTLAATAVPTRSATRVVDDVARVGDDRRRDGRAVATAEGAERHEHERGWRATAGDRRSRYRSPTRAGRGLGRACAGVATNERSSLGCTQGRSSGSGGGPLARRRARARRHPPDPGDMARSVPTCLCRSSSPPTSGFGRVGAVPQGARDAVVTTMAPCIRPDRRSRLDRRRQRCPAGRRRHHVGHHARQRRGRGLPRRRARPRRGPRRRDRPHLRGLRGGGGHRSWPRSPPRRAARWPVVERVALLHRIGRPRAVRGVGRGGRVVAAPAPRPSRPRGSASTP